MKLYHGTTESAAQSIRSKGFQDADGHYGFFDDYGHRVTHRGAFFSDRPLDGNEGLPPDANVFFIVDIPKNLIANFELIEEGTKGYREWCIPVDLVNKFFIDRTIYERDALEEFDMNI